MRATGKDEIQKEKCLSLAETIYSTGDWYEPERDSDLGFYGNVQFWQQTLKGSKTLKRPFTQLLK